jgi:hypothetical protein
VSGFSAHTVQAALPQREKDTNGAMCTRPNLRVWIGTLLFSTGLNVFFVLFIFYALLLLSFSFV